MGDTAAFLDALTSTTPEGLFGYSWSIAPDGRKTSTWHPLSDGSDAIAERVLAESEAGSNVYWGVSASAQDRGPHQRVKSEASAGIYGLWVEIDYEAGAAHQKMGYPPDEAAALSIIKSTGLTPTILLNSGHGLHAWWVFSDFWAFETDMDRSAAASLAERWQATVKARAAEQNWIVDSTFDLARVLRIPGTKNYKVEPFKDVIPLDIEAGRTHSPEDVEEFVLDNITYDRSVVKRSYQVGHLVLDPAVDEPRELVELMCEEHDRFRDVLNRTEKIGDGSPSAYDMSLATMCAHMAWSDQNIVDLLISNRRRYGDDLKLRQDYYALTLRRARERTEEEKAIEHLPELTAGLDQAVEGGDEEEAKPARRKVAEAVSARLGFNIQAMFRYEMEPPEFAIEIVNGQELHLGPIEAITEQKRLNNAILASDVAHTIPSFKKAEWTVITAALRSICINRTIGIEATATGAMIQSLREYLFDRPPIDNTQEAVSAQHPYTDAAGRVCIFVAPFRLWLHTTRQERMAAPDISRVLRSMGATPDELRVPLDGREATRQVWVLPKSHLA